MRLLKRLILSFSFRLYLLYFLLIGGSAWVIVGKALDAVDDSVNQAAEEILVDSANFMAEFVGQKVIEGEIQIADIREFIPDYLNRKIQARIYSRIKTRPDLQVYITDDKGIVLYDSTGQSEGKDFSGWIDVSQTLRGFYGARSSPLDHSLKIAPPEEKGLYIAAPIIAEDQVIGVLTVTKASRHLGDFVVETVRQVSLYAIAVFFVSLVFGIFITWWLTRSIKKLAYYAKQLGQGNKVSQPKIIHSEFSALANSMEKMREDLDGKQYVENYIHTMAHELKSPLTGIIGSAELLQSDLPEKEKQKFIDNIHESSLRMNQLIERLLSLASLEKRNKLDKVTQFSLTSCINNQVKFRQTQIQQKSLNIHIEVTDEVILSGDATLIEQSIGNLLDNAIDFTPCHSDIHVFVRQVKGQCIVDIIDSGEGITDFAQARLFERFFSTPRPHSQKRSSGLGLAFVKEAIALHQGDVSIVNHSSGGAIATITLPITEL